MSLLDSLSFSDLSYYLFDPRNVHPDHLEAYEATYKTWRSVWTSTREELGLSGGLPSDGFTRQHRIGSLMHGATCAGLWAFTEVDFSTSPPRDDSMLSAWSEEAFSKLTVEGQRVMVAVYLSVHPEYRGPLSNGFKMKDLLTGMSMYSLIESGSDVMTGTMRKNRGTDKSAYRFGARLLAPSRMYGVEVDLVGWFRSEIQAQHHEMKNLWSESLWQRRTLGWLPLEAILKRVA